ncbi:MAG: CrcB family protein [Planctomycetaceae bacterium]|nr:CrcB family protein [Planctomycetaceae bacterium]
MTTLGQVIGIGLAGAFGTLARYGVNQLSGQLFGRHPWGTVIVNLLGCLLFGFLAALFTAKRLPIQYQVILLTGFFGGFTTFSAYAFEIADFLEHNRYLAAMGHFSLQNIGGVLAVSAGLVFGRYLAA